MLGKTVIEIDARTDIMASAGAANNVDPSHLCRKMPGGRIELPTKGL